MHKWTAGVWSAWLGLDPDELLLAIAADCQLGFKSPVLFCFSSFRKHTFVTVAFVATVATVALATFA